jgi:hypothetical protein
LTAADGRVCRFEAASLPKPLEIVGAWELRFPAGSGTPEQVTLQKLVSWSEHGDPGVKHFSGTAIYAKRIDVPARLIAKDKRLYLDLGRVEAMAEVKLNGRSLGILWRPPYCVEVTDAAKAGENSLDVSVVNLWVNRMIGDELLPEDSDRNPNGTLKSWPKWIEEGKPSPTSRHTFTSWRLWKREGPLQPSGLLGPVTLRATETVAVK